MSIITFDKFDKGLDVRQGRSVADANRLRVLDNMYIGPGRNAIKRPGLVKIADLFHGSNDPLSIGLVGRTRGLFARRGDLATIGTNFNFPHDSTGVPVTNIANVNSPANFEHLESVQNFNGQLYFVLGYRNEGDYRIRKMLATGAGFDILEQVPGAPQVQSHIIMGEKIFAADGQDVKFSATGDFEEWTTGTNATDPGFLPTGIRAPGSSEATALGDFGGRLAVFTEDAVQIWFVDPDQSRHQLEKVVRHMGTLYPRSIQPVGDDLFFLNAGGVRSLSRHYVSGLVEDDDVGTPIDPIIQSLITEDPVPPLVRDVRSFYYWPDNQYWLMIDGTIYVYTYSKRNKIRAWSRYVFRTGTPIEDMAILNNRVYVRDSNSVYEVRKDAFTDAGNLFTCDLEPPFLSFKEPGILKMMTGVDFVGEGTPTISHRYYENQPTQASTQQSVSQDMRPNELTPVELLCTGIAPVLSHTADEPFQVDAISYHYEPLGPM